MRWYNCLMAAGNAKTVTVMGAAKERVRPTRVEALAVAEACIELLKRRFGARRVILFGCGLA